MQTMERSTLSLIVLTFFCAFAAALFGFGVDIFTFRSAFEGAGRETLMLLMRLVVYVTFAVILVLKGHWLGVLAAIAMAIMATTLQWSLFPVAFQWAAINDPDAYTEVFGEVARPLYFEWPAVYDVLGVGISAVLTQGLRMMAHVNPTGPQDE
ncbi:hypothetical protein BH23ACT11_BH23ACT11_25690 [soil metagenome]